MSFEIEIRTTKTKLTKSLVNQMGHAGIKQLREGTVLGYVLNVVKDCHKALILAYNGNYYTIPTSYKKGTKSIFRNIGRWTKEVTFDSEETCREFWQLYQDAIAKAEQIYI